MRFSYTHPMNIRALLLVLMLAIAPAAAAQTGESARPAPGLILQPNWIIPVQGQDARERRPMRPLREVIDMLRAQYGGEYVGHRLEDGPRPVYVIRWRMPDGVTLRDFRVDATR